MTFQYYPEFGLENVSPEPFGPRAQSPTVKRAKRLWGREWRSLTSLPSPPLLFIAIFTSHRSPLSERLEQATAYLQRELKRKRRRLMRKSYVSRSYGSSPVARLYLAKYEAPEEEAAVVPFALLLDQPQENFLCEVSSHSMLLCNAFTTCDRSIPQVK